VLVDDTPLAFLHQPANGVPVLGFRGDPDDRLLMEAVLPLLQVGIGSLLHRVLFILSFSRVSSRAEGVSARYDACIAFVMTKCCRLPDRTAFTQHILSIVASWLSSRLSRHDLLVCMICQASRLLLVER
jgi:hypothetical protein